MQNRKCGFRRLLAGLTPAACLFLWLPICAMASQPQPLFESTEPLEVTLSLPLFSLLRSEEDLVVAGTLTLLEGGERKVLDVEINKRGHSRLEFCDMPPLKLNFSREQVAGTVFENQDKLKLVNQCQDGRKYERYLHQEYGIYRAYLALTPEAFRVRMLEVTFNDSEGRTRERTRPAFLIEADDLLADRLDAVELELPEVPLQTLDPTVLTRVGFFQYLIANTDWSVLQGRSEDPCCHNGLLLETADGRRIIVPYDFDQAGLIDTEYALPARGLGIREVSDRLFRGLCTGDALMTAGVQLMNDRREQIEAAFPAEGKLRHGTRRALRYIDEFYEIINDPEAFEDEVLEACRGKPEVWASPG
jgi:hypothetical protein